MDFKEGQVPGVFKEGQGEGDREFYRVLNDLIWHVQAQSFDLRKFNALYMELLTSASQIFHLEEELINSGGRNYPDPKNRSQYLIFSEQLSRLNTLCCKRGISATSGMLTFLQEWFWGRLEALNGYHGNNAFETQPVLVNQ